MFTGIIETLGKLKKIEKAESLLAKWTPKVSF
jgi:pentatricopeptide repeat protein